MQENKSIVIKKIENDFFRFFFHFHFSPLNGIALNHSSNPILFKLQILTIAD